MTSNALNTSVEELHKASKLHENNLVIELGIDRIVTWLGVYLMFILGVLLEVEEIFGFGRGLSCFPENYTNTFTKNEAELASLNCWEISSSAIYGNHCLQRGSSSVNLADYTKLDNVKYIVKLFPLFMIFLAFLTSLPTVCWHFNFGSRLLAHLKLIQFLLDRICEAINKIEKVDCSGKPYDSDSSHFIGKMPFCDPGIELALHRMNNACHHLIFAYDSEKLSFDDSLKNIRDGIPKLCNYLKATSTKNEPKYKKALKTFCEIEEFFKEDPLNEKERFLLQKNNCSELKRKCVSSLNKISERKISFIEVIDETWSNHSCLELKNFRDITLGARLPLHKILEAKLILNVLEKNIKLPNDIKKTMETFTKNIETLSELKKELDTLCTSLRSLERKLREHKDNKMLDRHFLSLLCYENFASLYYIPYIHLVFRVFERKIYAGFMYVEERSRAKIQHPKHIYAFKSQIQLTVEAALMSWCHPDNMTARRLVSNYLKKQYLTMFIAFIGIFLFGGSFAFIRFFVNDSSQNLHCALPHICLICSLLGETRLNTLIVTACCSYVIVFIMLCYQVVTFNDWLPTNNSHLFELLQDLSMDALNEDESDEGNSLSVEFDGSDLVGSLLKGNANLSGMGILNKDKNESAAGNSASMEFDASDMLKNTEENLPLKFNTDQKKTTGISSHMENELDYDNEDPANNANQRPTNSAEVQAFSKSASDNVDLILKKGSLMKTTSKFRFKRATSLQSLRLSDQHVEEQTKPFLDSQV